MPENDQEIVLAYLREHGRRENLETLKENLRAQGYDLAVIEQASVLYVNEHFRGAHQSGPSCLRLFVAFILSGLAAISLLLSLCGGEGMIESGGLTVSGAFMIACAVLVILALFVAGYTFSKPRKK